MYPSTETQLVRDQVLRAAHKLKSLSNATFVIANEADNEQELHDLQLDDSGEDVNVGYFKTPKIRYRMEPTDEFDSDKLIDFIHQVESQQLKPVIKSAPLPLTPNPNQNLWTVVGSTFEELVTNDRDHDILIEFYAPWCGYCKKLAPEYEQLARTFELDDHRVRIMKLDASQNDFPEVYQVDGYPTIYYVPSVNKDKPLKYQGEPNLDGLSQFVYSNLKLRDEL